MYMLLTILVQRESAWPFGHRQRPQGRAEGGDGGSMEARPAATAPDCGQWTGPHSNKRHQPGRPRAAPSPRTTSHRRTARCWAPVYACTAHPPTKARTFSAANPCPNHWHAGDTTRTSDSGFSQRTSLQDVRLPGSTAANLHRRIIAWFHSAAPPLLQANQNHPRNETQRTSAPSGAPEACGARSAFRGRASSSRRRP